MSDRAVDAVRRKKDSSVSRAVDLVKKGDAAAIVSAGHTGAAVAATTIKLRTLPGVDRPGIAAVIPSETNVFVLIDAGANSDPRPDHMVEYAIMGSVYSRHVLGYEKPSVGLMSIGDEDMKGSDLTKEVFKMLKQSDLNFRGNIEGHDLFADPVEVVVCDGFVGNVILKTCESIGDAIFKWLKHELMKIENPNGRRVSGAERLSHHQEKSELRGIWRDAAPRREWDLHHRAWRQHAAGDQECVARGGRID